MLHVQTPQSLHPPWSNGELACLSPSTRNPDLGDGELPRHPLPTSLAPPSYTQRLGRIASFSGQRASRRGLDPPHSLSNPGFIDGGRVLPPRIMSAAYDNHREPDDLYGPPHPADVRDHTSLPHARHMQHAHLSQPASRTASRPASPVRFANDPSHDPSTGNRVSSHHAVASYLHLPKEIANGRHGSLAEFAAQITCLFWFESATVLQSIENSPHAPAPTSTLALEGQPGMPFLKWVTTILTTTQVANNVVLLALMFIYRLKKQNPQVQGKQGSEYRLLTVALMLGNKFLDDNTYTNKTWAEVSGISVHEIHVMEVEFLSHMKYNLYTSKEQWKDWFVQLAKFWTYFHDASNKLNELSALSLRNQAPLFQSPFVLPSPPNSTTASPPYAGVGTPVGAINPSPANIPPHLVPVSISPANSSSEYDNAASARKRSWDEAAQEPWPKRQHVQPHQQGSSSSFHPRPLSRSGPLPSLPTLPIPHLPLPHSQLPYSSQNSFPTQPLHQLSTPLTAAGRSTPTTYLPPASWLQGVPSATPNSQNLTHHRAQLAGLGRLHTPGASGYGTSPRRDAQALSSTPSASGYSLSFENQPQLSPSHYLSKRTSPYRPVRDISQLVKAPPSSHMAPQYPAQVSHDQIQWQPLKKNVSEDERRNGRVPYYDRNAWPPSQQYHGTAYV